jgi:NAD(P)H-dependent flavin oxidoreductase YrpB (nitropropane dioxygenase family)
MATRFIATHECDADDRFKQAVLDCKKQDIDFTKSPSKLHGRALKTNFMIDVNQRKNNIKVDQCVACLATCNPLDTPYCITDALIQSVKGNVDQGIVFVGAKAYEITEIVSVKELVDQLKKELMIAYET